jgi:hypothetical protein
MKKLGLVMGNGIRIRQISAFKIGLETTAKVALVLLVLSYLAGKTSGYIM